MDSCKTEDRLRAIQLKRQTLTKSTGRPIEESGSSSSSSQEEDNNNVYDEQAERKTQSLSTTHLNQNQSYNNSALECSTSKLENNKKKLAQLFSRSFFNRSVKLSSTLDNLVSLNQSAQSVKQAKPDIADSITTTTTTTTTEAALNGDIISDQSNSLSGSGDEWQLLETDDDEITCDLSDQNMQISALEMSQLNERMQLKPGQTMENILAACSSSSAAASNLLKNNNPDLNSDRDNEKNATTNTRIEHDPLSKQHLSPRLVHLCTAVYALVPVASLFTFLALIWVALFTRFWYITLVYYSYIYLQRNVCNRGGARSKWFYEAKFWTYLAGHFPIRLRYSPEFKLNPNENYILNYHPHGISAFGCVTNFATNGLNFTQLFPGIRARFMVHETSFLVPLMREIFLYRGDCSVNSKSIDFMLEKKHKQPKHKHATGNLLALVGGGLAEADLSEAEVLKIVVATRKGFVKKALIHGAHLIPCIAFGENSVFTKVDFKTGSLLHKLESRWYSLFKFKHPFYYGTNIFGLKHLRGALPYQRPITVVMGDPISVERVAEPTQEQVDQLHAKYLQQLRSLYQANRDLCSRFDLKMELV